MQTLLLYTTVGCHLCEQAEELLKLMVSEKELAWQAVDIADDQVLMERYGIRIPVVRLETGGAELGWPFDIEQLRDFLSDTG